MRPASHFDLFGPVGFGLDPIQARRIGIMPAMYHYSASDVSDTAPTELLRRLAETRQTLLSLHLIEERSGAPLPHTHTPIMSERTTSEALGLVPSSQSQRLLLEKLAASDAQLVADLFYFDRRAFWELVDKLEFLLGLFQDTDSTIEESRLAFFEQREWRLPYNSQENTRWYCLGGQPKIRDPNRTDNTSNAEKTLAALEAARGRSLSEEEKKATWVLKEVDGRPFSRMIREIICPREQREDAAKLIQRSISNGMLDPHVRLMHPRIQ